MNITEITKRAGGRKQRKRVGRGNGSGQGGTAGRGHKGAGQRSGYRRTVLAEGGMFPFFRRIPKFGFNNALFRTEYQIVNVSDLQKRFDAGANVTAAAMEEAGLIRDQKALIKVLGDGELTANLTIEAHRFTKSAEKKIEAAGGKANWLAPRPKKKFVKRPKVEEKPEKGKQPKGEKGEKGKAKDGDAPKKAKAEKKKEKPDQSDKE